MAEIDVGAIRGNAPDKTKAAVADAPLSFTLSRYYETEAGFCDVISKRVKVVEITLNPQKNSSKKMECVVTSEVDVETDMVSGLRTMHGGCTSFLMDICTSLPLVALAGAYAGVTSSLRKLKLCSGCKLQIITRSVAVGKRIMSAQGEIWDVTNSKLHATGTHMKMLQSRQSKL